MRTAKSILSALILAAAVAGPAAAAGDDWFRSTGGVAPQTQDDSFYRRATGGVAPQAEGDSFYFRNTGGVSPVHAD
jgi:ABC-type sugar transport system substrate-binding protein